MKKAAEIAAIVDGESPGLLDRLAHEDGISKEALVHKVLALSRGRMVHIHQNRPRPFSDRCDSTLPAPSAPDDRGNAKTPAIPRPPVHAPGNPAE